MFVSKPLLVIAFEALAKLLLPKASTHNTGGLLILVYKNIWLILKAKSAVIFVLKLISAVPPALFSATTFFNACRF